MCETMKSTICKAYGVLLLAGTLLMAACDDWTKNEKIGIDEPQFGERNPELHARYLESLRAYKAGEHIRTYVWFDNTEKLPASRGGFFADVPDSVDVVALTAPGRLTASELEQVAELRGKGTRVIGAVDCTALLAQWEASQPQEPETPATEVNDGGEGATDDPQPAGDGFAAWLGERLGERIDEIEADALDGLTICYEPRETIFMTDAERAVTDITDLYETFSAYADYYTINWGSMTPEILADVLTTLEIYKQRLHRPVFLKLPADVPVEKLDAVIEFAKVHHIDGFIATGPTQDRSLLIHSAQTEVERVGAGGISGLPVIHKSLEVMKYLSAHAPKDMLLIGAGGVMTPFEAKAMRNAGAHLVQVYSAFIYEGPGVVKRIAEKI